MWPVNAWRPASRSLRPARLRAACWPATRCPWPCWTGERRYLDVNPAWEQFTGQRREAVLGQPARHECSAEASAPARPDGCPADGPRRRAPLRGGLARRQRSPARPLHQQGQLPRHRWPARRHRGRLHGHLGVPRGRAHHPCGGATRRWRPRAPSPSSSPTSATSCAPRCSPSSASRSWARSARAPSPCGPRCLPTCTALASACWPWSTHLLDLQDRAHARAAPSPAGPAAPAARGGCRTAAVAGRQTAQPSGVRGGDQELVALVDAARLQQVLRNLLAKEMPLLSPRRGLSSCGPAWMASACASTCPWTAPRHPAGRAGADLRGLCAVHRHQDGFGRHGPRPGHRAALRRGPRRRVACRQPRRRRAVHGVVAATRFGDTHAGRALSESGGFRQSFTDSRFDSKYHLYQMEIESTRFAARPRRSPCMPPFAEILENQKSGLCGSRRRHRALRQRRRLLSHHSAGGGKLYDPDLVHAVERSALQRVSASLDGDRPALRGGRRPSPNQRCRVVPGLAKPTMPSSSSGTRARPTPASPTRTWMEIIRTDLRSRAEGSASGLDDAAPRRRPPGRPRGGPDPGRCCRRWTSCSTLASVAQRRTAGHRPASSRGRWHRSQANQTAGHPARIKVRASSRRTRRPISPPLYGSETWLRRVSWSA